MSLLPGQIIPQTVPIGQAGPDGLVRIDKNWWLLIYNLCSQVFGGNASDTASAQAFLLEDLRADADGTDVAELRRRVENALVLAHTALLNTDQIPNQNVDKNARPYFASLGLGKQAILTALLNLDAGTTTVAPVQMASGSLLTTPVAGTLEWDGHLFYSTDASLYRGPLRRTLFTMITPVTVTNTAVETTLIGAGVGSLTLPLNYGFAGKTIKIEAWGFHTSVSNPTVQIRIYKGSTLLLDTTALASGNSTNALIRIDAMITWVSGTSVWAQGYYKEEGGGASTQNFPMVNTSAVTVNAASEALNVTFTWGTASASNTVTLTNLAVLECN